MLRTPLHALTLLALAAALATVDATAQEAFFRVRISQLELTDGELPPWNELSSSSWWSRPHREPPYAVLDGPGDVYLTSPQDGNTPPWEVRQSELVVRVEPVRDVTGTLFLPAVDGPTMARVRFTLPARLADDDAKTAFYQGQLAYYESLQGRDLPGAAWFRHRARLARKALGTADPTPAAPPRPLRGRQRAGELADTYALFTGGRAMSENLQLDRVLATDGQGDASVELASLEGITVREIDWKPLVAGLQVELDPLARWIPADQHAVFCSSFAAAVAMADEIAQQGGSVMQLAEPRSTSAQTWQRYQRQMCLSISGLARLIGPSVAQSVAITGSDTYFRTGTDVAVLFETENPAMLEELLFTQVRLSTQGVSGVQWLEGEEQGVQYRGARTADRDISVYLAKLDAVVIVTNSPWQLRQLGRVAHGQAGSLSELDEYRFFRHRYDRGQSEETAFLFLSDATIRRWCGPQWRIATSRRTRDAAVLSELQASYLDRLVEGQVSPGPIYCELPLSGSGEIRLTPDGATCSTVGSLAFLTPIAEMKLDRVTPAEATAYRQWRDRYQANWRWAFDPIGLRIAVAQDHLSADLTVMPLIWGSDYRTMINISRGAQFASDAGDLHDSLLHVILAINRQSEMLQQQSNFARMLAGGAQWDPIGWLGNSVALYLDDDPLWAELGQIAPDERSEFLEEQGWRTPLALRADVSSGLKLTAFLAGLRGFIEQSAPGMLSWESLTYREQPYVKISPTPRAIGESRVLRNAALYYCASGKSLVVTPNQRVLQRAIDRELAGGSADASSPAPAARPWLGSNLAMQVEQKVLGVLAALGTREYQAAMQSRAWSNLPILNEWKRRYPQADPVALHERFWQIELVCPGGGEYVWDEQWQTFVSTVYGCPAAPREGPPAPPALTALRSASFGLTFEDEGLRARVRLER